MTLRRQLLIILGLQLAIMAVMAFVVQRETTRQLRDDALLDQLRSNIYAIQDLSAEIGAVDEAAGASVGALSSQILSDIEQHALTAERRSRQVTINVLVSVGIVFVIVIGLLWLWALRSMSSLRRLHKDIVVVSQNELSTLEEMRELVRGYTTVKQFPEIASFVAALDTVIERLGLEQQRVVSLSTQAAWRSVARELTHEIRNVVTPIKLAQDSLVEQYPDDPFVAQLESGLIALSKLTTDLKELAQTPVGQPEMIDIHASIPQSNVGIELQFDSRAGEANATIWADPVQWASVMNNIVTNARQAGATLVQISVTQPIESYLDINFVDNGPGMSQQQIAAVRLGRFTSKTDGTGTGLMVIRNFVDAVGGSLQLESDDGKGLHLALRVPHAEAPVQQ